jgi:hypothetical protein
MIDISSNYPAIGQESTVSADKPIQSSKFGRCLFRPATAQTASAAVTAKKEKMALRITAKSRRAVSALYVFIS